MPDVVRLSQKGDTLRYEDAEQYFGGGEGHTMKHNIIRSLNTRGCDVTVLPWNTTAGEIREMAPDGLFISNGPGNPEDAKPVIELVRQLRGELPIFGICLGHQIIALSYGAKTYKLKFGHRGGNHPVKNLATGNNNIAFTGDVYINTHGLTAEQAEYNQYAPILMTSVDTDPKLCSEERKAILRRLGVGNWKIFGAHGAPKEYAVK